MENKAYKFRLYNNREQKELINRTFRNVRFTFNYILSDSINYYKENKKSKINVPVSYKIEFPFLKEVDSLALANAKLQVKIVYKNFFNGSEFPKKCYREVKGNIKLVTIRRISKK